MKNQLRTTVASLLLTAYPLLNAQQSYHVTELPGLQASGGGWSGGSYVYPTYTPSFVSTSAPVYGINDAGQAVTSNALYSGAEVTYFTPVYPVPSSPSNVVYAWELNNSGVVAGHGGYGLFPGSTSPAYDGYLQRGFVYDSATSTMTNGGLLPGGIESRFFTINNSGTAAGWALKDVGASQLQQAVTFGNGTLTNVHNQVKLNTGDAQSAVYAITDSGALAGVSVSAAGQLRAFRFNGSESTALGTFGGNNSVALGASDTKTVGWAENSDGNRNAFVFSEGDLTNIQSTFTGDLTSKSRSAAAAVNEAGLVVGQAWNDSSPSDPITRYYDNLAFVSDGNQTWSLSSLVNSTVNWKVRSASDINESGQIAATVSKSSGYYAITSGAILTPETAWTAAGNGTWDTPANWQGGSVPGVQGAAALSLQNGVTVSGPSAPTTIFALSIGAVGNGSAATLALQSGGALTVTGDTELRAGATIDATSAALRTSFLHGSGSVTGDVEAGLIYTRAGQMLNLSGNITADSTLVVDSGILKIGGTLHSAVSGTTSDAYYYSTPPLGGTVQLTSNATLGGNDIAQSVSLGTLDAGAHSAVLQTSGSTSHSFNSVLLNGGQVTASAGIRVADRIAGGGIVDGNLTADSAVIQPGADNSLTITGNLSGSGLLVGSNISVNGTTTPLQSTGTIPSANIGTEDATFFGLGRANLNGVLTMDGGTVTAANGLTLSYGELTGSGIISGTLDGRGLISANGNLTLGDASSATGIEMAYMSYYPYYGTSYYGGTINTGANTVTLLDLDGAEIYSAQLAGGTLNASNGLRVHTLSGFGAVNGSVADVFGYSSVTATGALTLGDAASTDGVSIHGGFSVGNNTVTLLDADAAQIGNVDRTVSLSGGTITADNGLELFERTILHASGANLTSTINANLTIANSIVEATDTNTLNITGSLTGYGVLLGNVNAASLNATAGDVEIASSLNVGARSMTFLAQSRAQLGSSTSLAGGTIGASNGIGLEAGSLSYNKAISGNGTINPGVGQSLSVANGILYSDFGPLTVNGDLTGYGILVGSVSVNGTNTLASSPSGKVSLNQQLAIGNKTATFYSNAAADVASWALVNIDGGSLVSSNGLNLQGQIAGYGSVAANVQLQSGVINAASGQQISVNGALSGYGVLVGNVTATSNSLGSPTGSVSISENLDIGNRNATVYSDGQADLFSVQSQGGNLNTGAHGANISNYGGYGTLTGDVSMADGLFVVDSSHSLNITGNLTGYGIVVGTHTKTIANPTGTVSLSAWSIGRTDVTVYSLEAPSIGAATLESGGYIFSPQGWEFGSLDGSGTIGGNVEVTALLSPGFSPGTITFEDDLTLTSSGTLVLEYAGTTTGNYDYLDVGGDFTLAGNLEVRFLDGFAPNVGFLPDWFEADGAFAGNFASVTWTGLVEGKSLTFDSLTGNLGVVAVPEPSTYALLVLGGAVAFFISRRKKQNI